MKFLLWIVLLAVVLLFAYVRLAPVDPGVWHVDPRSGHKGKGRWLILPDAAPVLSRDGESAGALLARLDAIARATPRTMVIAGSVAEGRITYETRSQFWGFPDYSTVEAVAVPGGATLAIYARLRFGRGDMGVNRRRVENWLGLLAQD